MKINIYYVGLILLFVACNQNKSKKIIKQDSITAVESKPIAKDKLEKLADGFKWAEGPAADKEGNVYFTDVYQNLILKWTLDNTLDTLKTNTPGTNGLFFDKDNNLFACEMKSGQISLTTSTGKYRVIASTYNGKSFNEPNDLWLDSKGGIYFSDPKYGKNANQLTQDGMHVYYISPDYKTVTRVIDDFEKPNGLIGTQDGKTLYVTDADAEKIYKYDILENGTLANKTLFVAFGGDGMTIDNEGNVYLSTNGKQAVDIFSPQGKLLKSISVPERVANMTFGGKNKKELYITGKTALYRIKQD